MRANRLWEEHTVDGQACGNARGANDRRSNEKQTRIVFVQRLEFGKDQWRLPKFPTGIHAWGENARNPERIAVAMSISETDAMKCGDSGEDSVAPPT